MKYKISRELSKKFSVNPGQDVLTMGEFDKTRTGYRIISLVDIPSIGVVAGDQGGFVSGPYNLSHEGDCWIFDDAAALDNSRVIDDAVMKDRSEIRDFAMISDRLTMRDSSYIGGNQRLSGDFDLYGNVGVTKRMMSVVGPVHDMLITDNHIIIGCQARTFEVWLETFEEVAIKAGILGKAGKFYWDQILLFAEYRGYKQR